MTALRFLPLALCTVAGAVIGYVLMLVMSGRGLMAPVLDYSALFSMGAVSVITLALGIRVKRFTSGRTKHRVEPIAAARILVLAQAGAYAGAVICGWHLSLMSALLAATGPSPTATRAIVLACAGGLMVIIGFIVQYLCKLPPEDTDENTDGAQGYATD
ncbi:DUF3180 domain-containing protein [Glutamicibacter sp. MNS18]|uniref:DUF3180 domain-containing protein n=1 Tax=Glutamicibacter sp. MNS18 TaxID=2989817 RepID=UPI002235C919|nr:DUF3180 domain-containing protein [Glutamicibacter sp. MNS18]MCW4466730.1 DUF3180 domain-containing protein [Glutamicibacter sp. MNS18]